MIEEELYLLRAYKTKKNIDLYESMLRIFIVKSLTTKNKENTLKRRYMLLENCKSKFEKRLYLFELDIINTINEQMLQNNEKRVDIENKLTMFRFNNMMKQIFEIKKELKLQLL